MFLDVIVKCCRCGGRTERRWSIPQQTPHYVINATVIMCPMCETEVREQSKREDEGNADASVPRGGV